MDAYELEDGTGNHLMEDGLGDYLLEQQVGERDPGRLTMLGVGG